MIRAIVTDIEGTTSSIEFVHTTLFPYARRELRGFLLAHAEAPDVRTVLGEVDALVGTTLSLEQRISTLEQWIDEDRKATPLKTLQGMIWRGGYESGALAGHVYPEVPGCLRGWHDTGKHLYVYSSGSEEAQRLIFGHSSAGDLTPLFSGYFDTRIGAKGDPASYARIRDAIDTPAADILFLSDIGAELDAAKAVGLRTCQLVRDERCLPSHDHPHACDFFAVETVIRSPG